MDAYLQAFKVAHACDEEDQASAASYDCNQEEVVVDSPLVLEQQASRPLTFLHHLSYSEDRSNLKEV